MSYNLQCKISDELGALLKTAAGAEPVSDYVRPVIEDLARGIIHLPDPPKPDRIPEYAKSPSGRLTREAIAEMVRRNEDKLARQKAGEVFPLTVRKFRLDTPGQDSCINPRMRLFHKDFVLRRAQLDAIKGLPIA